MAAEFGEKRRRPGLGKEVGGDDWKHPRPDFLHVGNEGSEAKPPVVSDRSGALCSGGRRRGRWLLWCFSRVSFACRER